MNCDNDSILTEDELLKYLIEEIIQNTTDNVRKKMKENNIINL